eukprot:2441560-Prymnesium_polylepis.1
MAEGRRIEAAGSTGRRRQRQRRAVQRAPPVHEDLPSGFAVLRRLERLRIGPTHLRLLSISAGCGGLRSRCWRRRRSALNARIVARLVVLLDGGLHLTAAELLPMRQRDEAAHECLRP